MDKKSSMSVGFTILLFSLALLSIEVGYLWLKTLPLHDYIPGGGGIACTMEAKLCPDGSYVGRSGPKCEFAPCPSAGLFCTSDSECPSTAYVCEAVQGMGYACSSTDPTCEPTFTITEGYCKLKVGNACSAVNKCASGLLCHAGICTSPQDGECLSVNDKTSCSAGYTCVQDCGPPLVRGDEPPPTYHCILNEVASQPRACPICLASNSEIDTPRGNINVTKIKIGDKVWSLDSQGRKAVSTVIEVSKTPVPSTHKVVHLVLSDGRQVWASPNHPTADGRIVYDVAAGDSFDGAKVVSAQLVPYWDSYTYDILPDSSTGDYFANGILLGSTLKEE